ncbi:GntR family transcriptional regulator [Hansschlegelia sp. KR7-227]|uniref:GntR family transcriptional regulator n=1 Tax=Hansschlegelia sp. KR7-227 TaxID=3400914 RepID=UPI003C0211AE
MLELSVSPNLIQQVYDRLLSAIIDHSLAPGARIRQQELAERLGVSRQPVSHALHLLHRQGLVAESGRKGFQVAPLDPERIRQVYEVRSALDALAARLAAARAACCAGDRAVLQTTLAAGGAVDAQTPLGDLIALDVDFHRALYRLSGNPAIEEMAGPQWPHMRRSMAAVLTDTDYRTRVWAQHREIAGRVLAGDGPGAEGAAQAHALDAGRATEERLRSLQSAA